MAESIESSFPHPVILQKAKESIVQIVEGEIARPLEVLLQRAYPNTENPLTLDEQFECLICTMLHSDPEKRPSAEEALLRAESIKSC